VGSKTFHESDYFACSQFVFKELSDISPYLLRTWPLHLVHSKARKTPVIWIFQDQPILYPRHFLQLTHSYFVSSSSSNITKRSIKSKLTLSNFLLPVLQLFRTVTDVGTQNCVETLMLGKQKPLVKQPGDWPGGFL